MTVQSKQIALKYVSKNRKVAFPLFSANLVFSSSLIGVLQAQSLGCACSKHECGQIEAIQYNKEDEDEDYD